MQKKVTSTVFLQECDEGRIDPITKKFTTAKQHAPTRVKLSAMAQTFATTRLVLFWNEDQNDLSRRRQRTPQPD